MVSSPGNWGLKVEANNSTRNSSAGDRVGCAPAHGEPVHLAAADVGEVLRRETVGDSAGRSKQVSNMIMNDIKCQTASVCCMGKPGDCESSGQNC